MTPTHEQIIAEAERRWAESTMSSRSNKTAKDFIIEVIREGWTPPEPVDPDLLAFREWLAGHNCPPSKRILIDRGHYDNDLEATPFLAGARMAREQERERARLLVEYVQDRRYDDAQADRILAKYRGEA